jgi:putative CocE/NonD family hydrolase
MRRFRTALAVAVLILAAGLLRVGIGRAQTDQAVVRFDVRDVMIPMRDGVGLHTVVYTPQGRTERLPILFRRTPYGTPDQPDSIARRYAELAADGYIFVVQDIRGRYRSEGTFVMQRPLLADGAAGIDEATDAWDSIDWLVKNVEGSNGRVGILGVSYDGWTAAMALVHPHPALRAASPQASPADMWMGDDFHHQGAFRLSYGFEYAAMMETSKVNEQFTFDRYDTYDWYLALGSLANVNERYLHGKIPSWNDFVAHPDYDAFWQRQTLLPRLGRPTVPTLNVAGWWDQEDFRGPLAIYAAFEKQDADHRNFLVVGPWNHGGWNGEGRALGAIDFGRDTGPYFRSTLLARFFAHYLKDQGENPVQEATTFEGGSLRWLKWRAWPPVDATTDRALYVHEGGTLSFEPPHAASGDGQYDSFVSDPAHPVPYRHRPIQATYFPGGSGWYTWQTEDQRFVDDRADVLSWESAPLDRPVEIAGQISAHLFASTTGTDADWVVKLIDVYPEQYPKDWKLAGYQLMVAADVLRGRYRESFEHPAAIRADTVLPYTVDLHAQSYQFGVGHRLMVQVQSTWFPLIDRNPQTFVPNIFLAKPGDFRIATHRIWHSPQYPTSLTLPVVNSSAP